MMSTEEVIQKLSIAFTAGKITAKECANDILLSLTLCGRAQHLRSMMGLMPAPVWEALLRFLSESRARHYSLHPLLFGQLSDEEMRRIEDQLRIAVSIVGHELPE